MHITHTGYVKITGAGDLDSVGDIVRHTNRLVAPFIFSPIDVQFNRTELRALITTVADVGACLLNGHTELEAVCNDAAQVLQLSKVFRVKDDEVATGTATASAPVAKHKRLAAKSKAKHKATEKDAAAARDEHACCVSSDQGSASHSTGRPLPPDEKKNSVKCEDARPALSSHVERFSCLSEFDQVLAKEKIRQLVHVNNDLTVREQIELFTQETGIVVTRREFKSTLIPTRRSLRISSRL